MRRIYLLGLVLSSFAIAVACSSSPSGDDGGTTDAANDTTTPKDGSSNDGTTTNDGSSNDGKAEAAADGAVTLTIRDYLQWCSVKVNNGTASTGDPQSYVFGPDASVALHGESASDASFYWGYWQGPGIGDGGQDLNQNVNIQLTGDVTIHACCPDNGQPLTQCTF